MSHWPSKIIPGNDSSEQYNQIGSTMWNKLHRLFSSFFSKEEKDLDTTTLEKRLKHSFHDNKYLIQALKHRSYLTTSGEKRIESNERLELLGDAVLGLVVTDFLYASYTEEEEGVLTNYKSLLVNRNILSEVAKEFGIGEFLLLNKSEERSGGRRRKSILSDAMEAIIGAIYLDGGLEAAKNFILQNITTKLGDIVENGPFRNNKSLLQEHCQSHNLVGPAYVLQNETGPDHKKTFTISVMINGDIFGTGTGPSKKVAEQMAANQALKSLNII